MKSGAYRYTVTFEAGEIVDDRLIRLLDTVFGAHDVEMKREAIRRPPRNVRLYPDELAVLEILSDRQAHRRKSLLERLGWRDPPARFYRVMQGLIDIDAVRKIRQGVYAIADAPENLDIPEARNAVESKRQGQVLEWLETPLSAPEIRERLGVSRQRVDQILKRLEREGQIARRATPGEVATYVWVRLDRPVSAALRQRPPRVSTGKQSLLSSLRADRLVLVNDLAEHLSRGYGITLRAVKEVERQGLLMAFRLGAKTYVTITALGLQHPQYVLAATPAPTADVLAEFGAPRTALLQTLQILGPQRTLDLTYAIAPDVFEGARSSGQYIQALETEGLIEPVSPEPGHANIYRLTALGLMAVQLIALACPPPSPEALKALADARWANRRTRQREAAAKRQGPQGLSPNQRSVVETLRRNGPLTPMQIFEQMDIPPKNSGSLPLMLKTLQDRGLVHRLPGRTGRGLAYQWRATNLS